MSGVPYVFATQTTTIPLAYLDACFNTPLTIGTTSVGLGNTVTTLANVTLTTATINNATLTNTAIGNLSSLIVTGNVNFGGGADLVNCTVTLANQATGRVGVNISGTDAFQIQNAGNTAFLYGATTSGDPTWSDGGGTAFASITYGTGVYNTLSDARQKDVRDVQLNYRSAIKKLWVGDFDWKEGRGHGFGVLAQQAYEALPDGIGIRKPVDENDPWFAEPGTFANLALWGVKDLYKLIDTLTARIAALEAKQ